MLEVIDCTVPCRNCGSYCKIWIFMSLDGPIQHPVCGWDACNAEMIKDQQEQEQNEFNTALKIAANPEVNTWEKLPLPIRNNIMAGRVTDILKSRSKC